jgi:hypothetical protein
MILRWWFSLSSLVGWFRVASCNWEQSNLAFGFRKKKVTIPEFFFGGRENP